MGYVWKSYLQKGTEYICLCHFNGIYTYIKLTISQLVVPGTHTAGSKLRCQTPTTHTKNITSIFSQARLTLPDDGSQTIRNTSE